MLWVLALGPRNLLARPPQQCFGAGESSRHGRRIKGLLDGLFHRASLRLKIDLRALLGAAGLCP